MPATKAFQFWGLNLLNQDRQPFLVGDINGDSIQDSVGIATFNDSAIYSILGPIHGNGTKEINVAITNSFVPSSVWGWPSQGWFPRVLADVNNDGMDDLVGFGIDEVFTSLSNGDGTFTESIVGYNRGYGVLRG